MIWPHRNNLLGSGLGVTFSRNGKILASRARQLAETYGLPFLLRGDIREERLLETMRQKAPDGLLVVHARGIDLVTREGRIFFHPGLGLIRIQRLMKGETDRLAEAAVLAKGDEVLDCTLGLGADALVLSFLTGETGRVVGLEKSLGLAILAREGLASYQTGLTAVDEAMRRIDVVAADHLDYLRETGWGTFDVVYFDPLFRRTVTASNPIQDLRVHANPAPVSQEAINLATGVAKKRVVLKERKWSREFRRLGMFQVEVSASRVAYGWLPGRGDNADA